MLQVSSPLPRMGRARVSAFQAQKQAQVGRRGMRHDPRAGCFVWLLVTQICLPRSRRSTPEEPLVAPFFSSLSQCMTSLRLSVPAPSSAPSTRPPSSHPGVPPGTLLRVHAQALNTRTPARMHTRVQVHGFTVAPQPCFPQFPHRLVYTGAHLFSGAGIIGGTSALPPPSGLSFHLIPVSSVVSK